MIHAAVVSEGVTDPMTAGIAIAKVSEPVVDPPVEAHVRPPIAGVKAIARSDEAPIAGSPQKADRRRLYPGARNPDIGVAAPRPKPRSPQIAIVRNLRLQVLGNGRRGYRDTDGVVLHEFA
jgi:hypothetical protein